MIFSVNTSFLYKNCYFDINGTKALDNIVASKAIIQGYIPYKDLFTTSGPFIYLIMTLGYLIGKLNGIFVLQTLGMCITLLLIWKLNKHNLKYRCFSIALSLVLYILIISSGATTTEWALPILTSLIYISNLDYSNNFFDIISGLLVGCLFMIHIVLGILGLLTIFYLSKRNFILKIVSLLLPIICFLIYIVISNGLSEFINMLFDYQIALITNNSNTIFNFIKRIIKCAPLIFFIFPIITYWKKDKSISYYFVFTMICLFFYFILGEESWVKFGLLVCYVPICLAFTDLKYIKYTYICLLTVMVFCVPFKYFVESYSNYFLSGIYQTEYDYLIQLKDEIDSNQDSIVIVDCSSKYYLMLDMNPEWYYYVNQSNIGKNNGEIANEMYDYLWDGEYKGNLYITSGRSGVYETIDQYFLINISYISDSLAIYEWYDGEIEDLY